jgi:hypothetical protein
MAISHTYRRPSDFRIIFAFAAINFSLNAPKSYTSTSQQAGQGNSCRSSLVKATSNTLPHLKQRIVIGIGKCNSIICTLPPNAADHRRRVAHPLSTQCPSPRSVHPLVRFFILKVLQC